ncbi:helix-turn-helix domain-containing protein [Bradyrhizobium sp. PMVTL-01]|uniref:helix-turn-helix domain-containing protein n=1 Tax=Bradyrhizobium sp. PMVTL-01 TaxID=3434999 RepID=UPI003F7271E8
MLDKGWRQADLARQAGIPRNAVSVYIRAASLPTPANLEKLAKALDVKPEQLLPNYTESAIERDNPELEFRVSPADPSKAWLRINRLVHTSTAIKIFSLLDADDANKIPD